MKVLYTTPLIEFPPRSGPHLRTDTSIKALSQICDLHVISRVPEFLMGGAEAKDHYLRHSKQFHYSPCVKGLSAHKWYRRAQKVLRKWSRNDIRFIADYAQAQSVDAIWFGFGNLSYNEIAQIHNKRLAVPLICDTDSVWSRFIQRELPLVTDEGQRAEIIKSTKAKEKEEKDWVEWCDKTLAVSEVDAEYYRELSTNPDKVAIFPNALDLDFYREPTPRLEHFKQPAVILTGSFGKSTSAMNKAADWVLKDIWPLVLQQVPQAHLYIVGNHSDISYQHICHPNITVAGRVASILPYLQHAQVAITPLQFESGTRFKILESGACKLPMVSTTLGAEGLNVRHGHDILIADEAKSFAQGIVYLIQNPNIASQLAERSYEFVCRGFGLDSLAQSADDILRSLNKKKR